MAVSFPPTFPFEVGVCLISSEGSIPLLDGGTTTEGRSYDGIPGNKMLAVGAAHVQDMNVETAETIVERIAKRGYLPLEQTMITSF